MHKMVGIYKELLLEANKFNSYYYKEYFKRKILSQFSKQINSQTITDQMVKESEEMLAMLRRQTAINNAYADSKLIIERQ